MFPSSDPSEIRRKLEALCPSTGGQRRMRLSSAPLLFTKGGFFPIAIVGGHGNVAKVEEDGVILHMDQSADPHAKYPAVYIPVVPPSIGAQSPFFTGGQPVRVPYSAVVDVWEDLTSTKLVNLWLRCAVVMAEGGWQLLPFLWPPEAASRP